MEHRDREEQQPAQHADERHVLAIAIERLRELRQLLQRERDRGAEGHHTLTDTTSENRVRQREPHGSEPSGSALHCGHCAMPMNAANKVSGTPRTPASSSERCWGTASAAVTSTATGSHAAR